MRRKPRVHVARDLDGRAVELTLHAGMLEARVPGEPEVLADAEMPGAGAVLSAWALEHGASTVRHNYDCRKDEP